MQRSKPNWVFHQRWIHGFMPHRAFAALAAIFERLRGLRQSQTISWANVLKGAILKVDGQVHESTRGLSVSGAERRWLKVFRTLNEFQARLFAADKALDLGRGGISRLALAALTGLSRTTITKAVEELGSGGKLVDPDEGRVRRVGGGRKKVEEVDPDVRELLKKMLQETTAGDPMSLLRWTSKSTRTMAAELTRLGHPVTRVTVARCVDDMGYSLQANRREKEGPQHANRDAQLLNSGISTGR
jgi:hypothetical protein